MKLLAFDTSSSACSIALQVDEKITWVHDNTPQQQARLILPKIDELLKNAHLTLDDLDAISFGTGPGSFTGVRIATSVAQGFAFAKQIPLIPISSLAALAQATYQDLGWKKQLVAVDARMGEVYWGIYQLNQQGLMTLQSQETICRPEVVLLPDQEDWYGVGTGWDVYKEKIPFETIALNSTRVPDARGLLPLAHAKWQRQEWVNAKDALPVYLRDKVAVKRDTR